MIEIRPLNSVHTLGDQDAVIGRFADFEWRDLIELAQQYGFDPPIFRATTRAQATLPSRSTPRARRGSGRV